MSARSVVGYRATPRDVPEINVTRAECIPCSFSTRYPPVEKPPRGGFVFGAAICWVFENRKKVWGAFNSGGVSGLSAPCYPRSDGLSVLGLSVSIAGCSQ